MESEKLLDEQSSDETDEQVPDDDTCSVNQIAKEFSKKVLLYEEAVTLKSEYVLNLANNSSFDKIASSATNGTVQIFSLTATGLSRSSEFLIELERKSSVCGLSFTKNDSNNLFVGTTDGSLLLYDLRTSKQQFSMVTGDTPEDKRRITCFDINSNDRIICAGTEQVLEDVYLIFFDVRQKSLLGGYWRSHENDITTVKFHPDNPDLLISGSVDCLINVFDISETTEDDALKTVINTEDSIARVRWHKNVYKKDIVSCITNTNEFKMYEVEEAKTLCEYCRSDITNAIKRKSVDDCYIINCHNLDEFGNQFLLAGSNYNKGETLRSLQIQPKSITPLSNYEDNKQIVRDSLFDPKNNILITSGESAIVSVWSNENAVEIVKPGKWKAQKSHGKKPY